MASDSTEKEKEKGKLHREITIGKVTLTQKSLLAKHLAVMLRSGLPLYEALTIAEESAQGKMKRVLRDVSRRVRSGHKLSDAFREHPKVFSPLFVNTVYAGESSGTLVENLEILATELEHERELVSKIRGAMIYPVIVLAATFILGLVIAFLVLPKITPLFEGLRIQGGLPATTRMLIAISHTVEEHGTILFTGILGGVVALVWLARRRFAQPVTHKLLLTLPLVKTIVHNTNRARFSRTLGMLLRSGVTIDESLEIAGKAATNFYYRRAILNISDRVARGTKLAETLGAHPHLFPALLSRMVRVGEESGKFEDTLFYLADFYGSEVDSATKALQTAIEPALLLIIGLMVGGLALSIITPIYEITGNIRR